ncbi:hypothetical protein [Streptomyces sp. SBT349]|uniref:hypothetical protein n=1 Tax=Streptomyces sp. SBT349 TaxID=1580539 RepID=UPI00066DDD06|nr:hypothetical protein [Streptomyces sp. SBT349]
MSTTRRSLLRRSAALLALTVSTAAALAVGYAEVHGDAAPLRDRTAPAILDVTAARGALVEAHEAAENAPGDGAFRVHIAVASQSVARAAGADVRGASGLRALETVSGLIVSYSGLLEQADREEAEPALRDAYLYYAGTTLNRGDDGILDRLDALQDDQHATLAAQASFDRPSRLAWAVAVLSFLGLVALLVETQLFLRRRFRRRYNLGLLGATATLLIAFLALTALTAQTHAAMAASRDQLADLREHPDGRSSRPIAAKVENEMNRTEAWDGLTGFVPVLGLALAAQTGAGLWPRIDQYRFRSR